MFQNQRVRKLKNIAWFILITPVISIYVNGDLLLSWDHLIYYIALRNLP